MYPEYLSAFAFARERPFALEYVVISSQGNASPAFPRFVAVSEKCLIHIAHRSRAVLDRRNIDNEQRG